jgi:sugar phosphate isomerase/epimerase
MLRFAFSNIAWTPHDAPPVLRLLRERGIRGIEVAPTKVWPDWLGATPAAAAEYRRRLDGEGFVVPALQAVLFGQPNARLFDTAGEVALVAHLMRIAELAGAFGAKAVVLGAPKQRDRGALTTETAHAHAAGVFRRLAPAFADRGTCLCIEPNPPRYGCNFVTTAAEGASLVRRVAHPGFGLHLDAAAMFLVGDELRAAWADVGALVRHYHISEPDLGDFTAAQVPHAENLAALRANGYAGWCSVEMREPPQGLESAGPWMLVQGENDERAA